MAFIYLLSGDQKRDGMLGIDEILSNDQGIKEAIYNTDGYSDGEGFREFSEPLIRLSLAVLVKTTFRAEF